METGFPTAAGFHMGRGRNRVANFQGIIEFESKTETKERMQEAEVT